MADLVDDTDRHISRSIEIALHLHQKNNFIKPEFDEQGAKICVECGVGIPIARAQIEHVVRCLDCQNELESKKPPKRKAF